MTQWRLNGLRSPDQLFQPPQPTAPANQPLLSPAQLSALAVPPSPSAPHPTPQPTAPSLAQPRPATDQFSGVSRVLAQQGRLPANPITISPQTPAPVQPSAPALPSIQAVLEQRAARATAAQAAQPAAPIKPMQAAQPIRQSRQPLADTFVFQFGEIGKNGSRMEAQGNCGPASAAIIIQEFGVEAPTMRDLRKAVGAPTGNRQRAYALTGDQVGRAVEKTLAEHGIQVDYEIDGLSTNVDQVLSKIRARLDAGEKVVLLSSNLASQSRGHYVVVTDVRADGSIVIDDPGARDGEGDVYSRKRLEQTLKTRANRYGLSSSLISFKEV